MSSIKLILTAVFTLTLSLNLNAASSWEISQNAPSDCPAHGGTDAGIRDPNYDYTNRCVCGGQWDNQFSIRMFSSFSICKKGKVIIYKNFDEFKKKDPRGHHQWGLRMDELHKKTERYYRKHKL